MVTITFNPKTYELEASGHADFAEKGKDIICASVTILMATLHKSLLESQDMLKDGSLEADVQSGYERIKCTPKEAFAANIGMIYWVVLNGLETLCNDFSEYVTFKEA